VFFLFRVVVFACVCETVHSISHDQRGYKQKWWAFTEGRPIESGPHAEPLQLATQLQRVGNSRKSSRLSGPVSRFSDVKYPLLLVWFSLMFAFQRGVKNMADEIKSGDVVQLKSGGPKMTVSKVELFNGVETAWCNWFVSGVTTQSGKFPVSNLKHVE
jgi:uncharacterized protein YodC (DUF2158 family)